MVGVEPEDAIRYLGAKRLQSLHVHDVDYITDLHTLPYQGKVNWAEITKALKEIGYEGDFTYEADNFLGRIPASEIQTGVNYMAALGRRLMAKIDAARPKK